MNDMQDDTMNTNDAGNEASKKNEPEEKKLQDLFTKPTRDGKTGYIEYEVESLGLEDCEVIRGELFSKANCPAVTFRYGSVTFNVRAIRKLGECSHVLLLINKEKKLLIAKPCHEDENDSQQWSRVDKHGKLIPRMIRGDYFSALLFRDMNWDLRCTFKVLAKLQKCKNEKAFIFELVDAEKYLSLSAPTADNPKRRERIPFIPEHWKDNFGQLYEDRKNLILETFDGVPDGYIKITLPKKPNKKTADDKIEVEKKVDEQRNKETTKEGSMKQHSRHRIDLW
jgi:hypothetical protein